MSARRLAIPERGPVADTDLSPECYERIIALLLEAEKADGSAAQDLAEFANYVTGRDKEPARVPRCDNCEDPPYRCAECDDSLAGDDAVCWDCFEDKG